MQNMYRIFKSEFILTDEYLWYLSKLIHDKNNNKNQTYKQTTKYK